MIALFLDARSIEPQLANDFACLGIEDAGWEGDPPKAVQQAVRDRLRVPVFPRSRCRRDEQTGRVIADGAAGEGTWLTIGSIDCANSNRCTATVSYYVANMGAGGRGVTATRKGNGWQVQTNGSSWIS